MCLSVYHSGSYPEPLKGAAGGSGAGGAGGEEVEPSRMGLAGLWEADTSPNVIVRMLGRECLIGSEPVLEGCPS